MAHNKYRHESLNGVSQTRSVSAIVRLIPHSAMETAYKDGKLRAIGISNFLEERYLDLVNHCKVIPAVNQVETREIEQLDIGKSLFGWW